MNLSIKQYTEELASLFNEACKSAISSKIEGDGTFEVIATTDTVDRDGEVIKSEAWELEPYYKNPVVLWGHNYNLPPIGAVTSLTKSGNSWIAKGVFAKTQFAQEVRSLYDSKMLNAVSVGFIAKQRQGNTITKAELLELSFVPVPANSEAITLRRMADFQEMTTKMLEKGMVTDHLVAVNETTEEDWKAKDGYISDCLEACYAFVNVLARPETKVSEVPELIQELSTILNGLVEAKGEELEDDGLVGKTIKDESFKAQRAEEKAGRVLSSKNRDKISGAIQAMASATGELQGLLDMTDSEKEVSEHVEKSDLEDLQILARIVDKSVEGFNRKLKEKLL